MNAYLRCKLEIGQQLERLNGIVQQLDQCRGIEDISASRWSEHVDHARRSLQEQLLRVAVVGSVKSGKSTFINALTGHDLLKRGAGITTAFITRIHTNPPVGGWVALKSWRQIETELQEVIRLLPGLQTIDPEVFNLNVRRRKDFQRLSQAFAAWQNTVHLAGAQVDPALVLLNAYLNGYPLVHDQIGETATRLYFNEHTLAEHQRYAGQEAQAVYLEDMELNFPIPWLGDQLEIADCQGSDSPNPLHFALLQDYLMRCHFVLYVVSGRTGLREADFKLLEFIKTLRLLPQTLFVLNADLDLHSDRGNLDQLIRRVHDELNWFTPGPRVFTFSALYQLLAQMGATAPRRDQLRLTLWREAAELTEQSETDFRALQQKLAERVTQQREEVLLGTALSRLTLLAGSLANSATARKRLLTASVDSIQQAGRQLQDQQQVFNDTVATLQKAISGSKDALKAELNAAVNGVFDLDAGPIVVETLSMVENYPIDQRLRAQLSSPAQLLQQLHSFYLGFRLSLARYLVEQVNVRVIEFSRQQEELLQRRLSQAASAFWPLFLTALEDYRRELARLQVDLHLAPAVQDADWMREKLPGPPQFSAFVQQGALSRGMLLVKFGLGRLSRYLTDLKRRLGRRFPQPKNGNRNPSLREAIELVKAETKAELLQAFGDYREVFKHKYLFVLLEAAAVQLLQEFQVRAEAVQIDFAAILDQGARHERNLTELVETLNQVQGHSETILAELNAVHRTLRA